jgi:hypothetical protein
MAEGQADKWGTKVCHRCHLRKPLTAFWRRAVCADRRDPWCSDCRGGCFRQWCADHRDRHKSQQRAYYFENRKRLRAYQREYQRRRRALMKAGKWNTHAT